MELALTLPVLMLLILAIAEFAMIGYHKMSLAQGARAGSREASIGGTLATIRSKTRASCSGLTVTDAQIVVEFNSNDAGTGTWGTVADNGSTNTVPYGRLVRVRIVGWPHALITGAFFKWLPGVVNNKLPLNATMVMRRE